MIIPRNLLFLAIEASGSDPATARIIRLSWRVDFNRSQARYQEDLLIKPSGFGSSIEDTQLHQVTNEHAQRFGLPLNHCLQTFGIDLETADLVVSHNAIFDIQLLLAEAERANLPKLAEKLKTTGGESTERLFRKRTAYPGTMNLLELAPLEDCYAHLFDRSIPVNESKTLAAAIATQHVFKLLVGEFTIDELAEVMPAPILDYAEGRRRVEALVDGFERRVASAN